MTSQERPAMTQLTARTLREAHRRAKRYRAQGYPLPAGIALLDQDYRAWRRRVQRGTQPDTLRVVEP